MSTYSSNLYVELIGTGEQTGTWGSTTNNNFQYVFEEAIVGRATVAFSDADVTLTPVSASTNQTFRNVYLNCTGTNTASRNLIVPNINKNYIVENNTTGGFNIVVKTSAGTGITVPNGFKCAVYVDGTNVVTAFNYLGSALTLSSLTVTGNETVNGTVTWTGGTANGVVYLNGSKVATSGSALTFDGTNFSIGGTSDPFGRFYTRSVGITSSGSSVLEISGTSYGAIDMGTGATRYFSLLGNSTDAIIGTLNGAIPLEFQINGSEQMRLTSTGLGIGTSSPSYKLDVQNTAATTWARIGYSTINSGAGVIFNGASTQKNWVIANQYNVNGGLEFTQTTAGGGSAIGSTPSMVLDSSGNLGIGTSSPLSKVDVRAANATMGNYQTIQAFSTDTATIDYGGGISLGGYYSGTSSIAQFASISGRKENGTAGNYAGYLQFGTNSQATGVREVMRLDSAGNLGVGTTSPTSYVGKVVINGHQSIIGGNSLFLWDSGNANAPSIYAPSDSIAFKNNAGSELMRINSTGLGIGTSSPSRKLSVETTNTSSQEITNIFANSLSNSNYVDVLIGKSASTDRTGIIRFQNGTGAGDSSLQLGLYGQSPLALNISYSGNLGLGVTPSAWGGNYKAFEGSAYGGGQLCFGNGSPIIFSNAYNNGTNWIYKSTQLASYYQQFQGQHIWYNAPSGTAGNAITFTQAMTLDASGNLLVGTTSSLSSAANRTDLSVNGTNTAIVSLGVGGTRQGYLYTPGSGVILAADGANAIAFWTNATERARISSNGNFSIGTTSSAYPLTIYQNGSVNNQYLALLDGQSGGHTWVLSNNAANVVGSFGLYDSTASGYRFFIDGNGYAGIGTTSPSSLLYLNGGTDDQILRIGNTNATGSQYLSIYANGAQAYYNSVNTQNSVYGNHIWNSQNNGGTVERARIDSSGNFLVGTTSAGTKVSGSLIQVGPAGGGGQINISGGYTADSALNIRDLGNNLISFFYGPTKVGSVTTNGTITVYNTTSDYRLKNVTGNLTGYKERLMSLQPKQGTWIADGSEFRGFLAHEFADSYSASVTGKKDAVDKDGKPVMQAMQASSSEVMADLVAMINELINENQSLKARLDAANL